MQKTLWTGLFSLLVLLTSPARADTSSSQETKDLETYGNCHVVTTVDLFTDSEGHIFGCLETTFTDQTGIGVVQQSGNLHVTLTKGLMFHLDPTIPIAIRIDKGPLRELDAHWIAEGSKAALVDHSSLALTLLEELAQGQRVVIKVGRETGSIRLNGSAKAIQDFKRRAGLIYQRSLEIPRQKTLAREQRQRIAAQDSFQKCVSRCNEQEHFGMAAQCRKNPLACD